MDDYCEGCQNLIDEIGRLEDGFRDEVRKLEDDGAGPPTREDDAWFTHHVASLGYPRVKRDPKPYSGQLTLPRPRRPHSWTTSIHDEIRCADCGLVTDPAFKSRYDEKGCEPFAT